MRPGLIIVITLFAILVAAGARAQGWVAKFDLALAHDYYARERITNVSVTFSGVAVFRELNETSGFYSLTMTGSTPLSGDMRVTMSGEAWEPDHPSRPPVESVFGMFTGNYNVPCAIGYFEAPGVTPGVHLYIWIEIHPRLEISDVLRECSQVTLISNACVPAVVWEVSEDPLGNFKTLHGKTQAIITVTREDLIAAGLTNPYGRKYFRVTGLPNTTSQLQPVDIYYPGPSISVSVTHPQCHGSSDGSVGVNISSALPDIINNFVVTLFEATSGNPLEQRLLVNESTASLTNLHSGTYRIRVENNSLISTHGNCWTENSFTITDPAPLTISSTEISNFNGYGTSCYGTSDGSIRIHASGGSGEFPAYEWSPPVSTGSLAVGLSAGSYSVTVSDSRGCSSEAYTYTITSPDRLTVDLLSTGGDNGFEVSCHDAADGRIEPIVDGGTPGYSYEWSNGQTTPSVSSLAPGTYDLTVTDQNGCEANASISLEAPMPISFSIAEIRGIMCAGESTGILEIHSINHAIGQPMVQWASGETTMQIADKPAGTYEVTVYDEQGCNAVRSHELIEPRSYVAEVYTASDYNGSPISCHGVSDGQLKVVLYNDRGNRVAGEHYTWLKNDVEFLSGASDSIAIALPAGRYKAEVTYRTYCKVEATLTLNEPDPVSAAIVSMSNYNGHIISCADSFDGHIRALASGGTGSVYEYQWDNGTESADLVGIGAGLYHVTVRDVNDCIGTAEKTIQGPEMLRTRINIVSDYHGSPVTCAGASDARMKALAQGGVPPYSFEWNTRDTIPEISDRPAGMYSVRAKDVNGCQSIADTILADPMPVVAFISEASDFNGFGVSCRGLSDGYLMAGAAGGTENYFYSWSGSANHQALYTNLAAGSYRLIVRDSNGCKDSLDIAVTSPDSLMLTLSDFSDVSCNGGNDGVIRLTAKGGTEEHTYFLDDVVVSEGTVDTLSAGSYTATVRDTNGCSAKSTVLIQEPLPLSIGFPTIEPALCGEPQGKVTSHISGGTAPYALHWVNAQGDTIGRSKTISELHSGIITLKVRDHHACEAGASVGIPVTDGPSVVATTTPASCSYSSDGTATLECVGIGPFTYRWPDGTGGHEALNMKKGTYLVEVTDGNNCTTVVSVVISAPDSLRVDVIEKRSPACNGDCNGILHVAAQGGTGDYNYQWVDGVGPTLKNLCKGLYTVTALDKNHCIATATVALDEPEVITTRSITSQQPSCTQYCDGVIEVEASGGTGNLKYEWSNSATGSLLSNLCAGTYTVIVRDSSNCMSLPYQLTLEDPDVTPLELPSPIVLCAGQTYALDPGPGWEYHSWSSDNGFTSLERKIALTEAGTYWLDAIDERGCTALDTVVLITSDSLLTANFLLTSEAFVLDTVVAIDISWPIPETTEWILPAEMHRLNDNGDVVHGQFMRAGDYAISLAATLGKCRDKITKRISIAERNTLNDNSGRIISQPLVRHFSIYPNPNDGQFDVIVELSESSPVTITVLNALTSHKLARFERETGYKHLFNIDLRPLITGNYVLRLDHHSGTQYLRFIVQ